MKRIFNKIVNVIIKTNEKKKKNKVINYLHTNYFCCSISCEIFEGSLNKSFSSTYTYVHFSCLHKVSMRSSTMTLLLVIQKINCLLIDIFQENLYDKQTLAFTGIGNFALINILN